jgi:hypothetical protein
MNEQINKFDEFNMEYESNKYHRKSKVRKAENKLKSFPSNYQEDVAREGLLRRPDRRVSELH